MPSNKFWILCSKFQRKVLLQGFGEIRKHDVMAMITLSDCDTDLLTYDRSDTKKDIPLLRDDRNLLSIFCHYVLYCNSIGHPIRNDWLSITPKDIDNFRVRPHCLTIVRGSVPLLSATTTTTQNVWSVQPQLAVSGMAPSGTHPYWWLSRMASNLALGNAPQLH